MCVCVCVCGAPWANDWANVGSVDIFFHVWLVWL